MQIRRVENKKDWDGFVLEHAPDAFFQSWNWGEVEKAGGNSVARYGFYKRDKLNAAAQCITTYAKRGNFLHIRHGPVLVDWNKPTIEEIFNFFRSCDKYQRIDFIRVSPRIKSGQYIHLKSTGFREAPIHNMDAELTLVVRIDKDIEGLLTGMRKNTRRAVRKAEKNAELKTEGGVGKQQLNSFLALFSKTARRQNFVFERGIKHEFTHFAQRGNGDIVIIRNKTGRAIAAAFISDWGRQGIYRYAGATREGLKQNAAYLCLWEAILRAKERGLTEFNLFGGISDLSHKNHPWYGLTVFKRGFGGEERQFIHAQDYTLSTSYLKTYFIERIIGYLRGYRKILGFRAPTWLRSMFRV